MDVPAHAVTAIIGPSGCGKSTFIRCLNRMHELVGGARASEGTVHPGRHRTSTAPQMDPVRVAPAGRDGVPEAEPVSQSMSIEDNVLAGLRLTGTLDRQIARRRWCAAR